MPLVGAGEALNLRRTTSVGDLHAGLQPAFAAPIALCHQGGTPLEVYGLAGPAPIPSADGDGVDDLIVGNAAGQVLLCQNVGTAAQPAFGPPSLWRPVAGRSG